MYDLSNLTMIVPTRNRNSFLYGIIYYHAPLVGKIIIVDDSEVAFKDVELLRKNGNVHYFHMKDVPFIQRILFAVRHVDTDFVVIRADRRQISNHGLKYCCEFLKYHKDFATADGHTFMEEKQGLQWVYRYCTVSDHCCSDVAEERVCSGMSLFEATWYAVHRSGILKDCFTQIARLSIDDLCFYEFYHTIFTLYAGKHKRVPCVYMYMPQINYDPSRKEISRVFYERLDNEEYLNNFYKQSSQLIKESFDIPIDLIKEAVGCYRLEVFAKKIGYQWWDEPISKKVKILKHIGSLLKGLSYTSRDMEYLTRIIKVRLMSERFDVKSIMDNLTGNDLLSMRQLKKIIQTTKSMQPELFASKG